MCVCAYTCVRTCIYVRAYMCVHIRVCLRACAFVRAYIYVCVCVCVRECAGVYVCEYLSDLSSRATWFFCCPAVEVLSVSMKLVFVKLPVYVPGIMLPLASIWLCLAWYSCHSFSGMYLRKTAGISNTLPGPIVSGLEPYATSCKYFGSLKKVRAFFTSSFFSFTHLCV